ncbi:MAG: efflux transporter outer membrane subunit [Desulfobacteraceae bacterium]|nr:efflux transporter outer membrane subunit [Desulfobacteraceae bacterium]
MSNKIIAMAAAILLLLTTGCTMIPEYKRPDLPVANSWPTGTAYPQADSNDKPSAGVVSDIAWKDYFKSEHLKALIERTLKNNRNLRVAALNIDRAKAAYRIQRSESFPTITGESSFSRTGTPEDLRSSGDSSTNSTLSANLAVTAYELDFFGRVKSLNKEALETYLSTRQALLNTRIVLIAETTDAYLTYLADKKLLKLAKDTLKAQQETYAVVKQQYHLGSVPQLDLAQATTSVESAKVSIAAYTRDMAQAKNTIVLLAGSGVDDLLNNHETIDNIQFMENLPKGLPSTILTARPDIREAEHQLKAANADIGAARAALYPKISLTGAFGLASDSLSSLFKSGAARAWNFTPSVSIPIFNREGLNASLEVAKVDEKIAANSYEAAIQTAFKEVADQLAARGTYKNQLAAQNALVNASQKAYELSSARYENGIDDFLTVLDSQRSLFEVEQQAVIIKQAYLSNIVNIYKVLGGGRL